MRCADIHQHFKQVGTWVDWDNTTDTFKAGDPDKPVTKIAVVWKANWDALRTARRGGADMVITHESICVRAVNGSTEPEVTFALPSEKPKFDWLSDSGLTVYRCHDFWDRYPAEGIRDSWRQGLDIGTEVTADEYPLLVTDLGETTLGDLARHVLSRIRSLGQTAISIVGDHETKVHRVATGTGVTTNPIEMIRIGADVGICTDDYFLHVRMGEHARELDFPFLIVNQCVSEAWGIAKLSAYLREEFDDVDVIHIPQICCYSVVL